MLILTAMRSFFMICVPLFITLSGYLSGASVPSRKYYCRIGKLLLTYLLASLLCMAYSAWYLRQSISPAQLLLKLLNFSGAPYAWYVEMYLGLFLLIPFLNILYDHVGSRRGKQGLLLTMIALTILPSMFNTYNFHSLTWWINPSVSEEMDQLIPAWWEDFYPITYYFLGRYLREYGLKLKRWLNLLLIALCALLAGLYSFWRSQGVCFLWGAWSDYGSVFTFAQTVLVFALFININDAHFSPRLAKLLQSISHRKQLCNPKQ